VYNKYKNIVNLVGGEVHAYWTVAGKMYSINQNVGNSSFLYEAYS
jgi:hypothetical protein